MPEIMTIILVQLISTVAAVAVLKTDISWIKNHLTLLEKRVRVVENPKLQKEVLHEVA